MACERGWGAGLAQMLGQLFNSLFSDGCSTHQHTSMTHGNKLLKA